VGNDQPTADDEQSIVVEQYEHRRKQTGQGERSDASGFLRPLTLQSKKQPQQCRDDQLYY